MNLYTEISVFTRSNIYYLCVSLRVFSVKMTYKGQDMLL
jgi:hypothetical protein